MITSRRTLLLVTMILLKINFSFAGSTEDNREKVLALLATIANTVKVSKEIGERESLSEQDITDMDNADRDAWKIRDEKLKPALVNALSISNEELKRKLTLATPIHQCKNTGKYHFIQEKHPRNEHLGDTLGLIEKNITLREEVPEDTLSKTITFTTYHTTSNNNWFQPSIDEVLAQLPSHLEGKLIYFSVVKMAGDEEERVGSQNPALDELNYRESHTTFYCNKRCGL